MVLQWKSALRLRLTSAPKLVLLLLLGAWIVDFFVFVCSESQASFYILSTATLCILGWANHLRVGSIRLLKDFGKWIAGLLFDLLLLILLGVMAYKLVEVYGDLSVGKEREARLRTQKEQKQEEVNSLKDALSHADDPDYILGLARDRLGLVEDGERIFRDVNN